MRGSWRPNITATYWPPLLWPSALCLSRSPELLNQRPTLLGAGFLYRILSPKGLQTPSGAPSTRRGFPYHISLSDVSDPQLSDFLSWPSYIIVQRLLNRPLNLWNGMFDRHQAEITVMQFSASVYECIMGFYLVPFHQPNPPTRSLSITGYWNVSLPSGASLWNGMFGRVEGQNTTK